VTACATACMTAFAAACTSDGPLVSDDVRGLVGEWASARETIGPGGTWERTLVVRPDGRVVHRGVSYGLYPGQRATDVSAETELHGRLGASASAFVVHTDSIVTRDRFFGPDARTVQREFPAPAAADSTRYAVHGDELELTYYSYPADAPVLTREVLTRRR
jgi:hypothetical protein